MIKALIIDDEEMARKALNRFCEKMDNIEVLGLFENGSEALDFMSKNEIDLIFLDVEMPGISGLEMLDQISILPQVIMITSNSNYAFDAYEYDVTDFLKKPITQPRFFKAIEKVESNLNRINQIHQSSLAQEIYVKSEGKLVRLPYETISFFENVGDYIKVVSTIGNYIIHGTLKGLDAKLNYPRFLKVHRSFIINLDKVTDIEDNTILIGKSVIPISRAHKSILMTNLNII